MTVEVSKLSIVVEASGIDEATNSLMGSKGNGGLAKGAEKAEKAVESLTSKLEKFAAPGMEKTLAKLMQDTTNMQAKFDELTNRIIKVADALLVIQQASVSLNSKLGGTVTSIKSYSSSMGQYAADAKMAATAATVGLSGVIAAQKSAAASVASGVKDIATTTASSSAQIVQNMQKVAQSFQTASVAANGYSGASGRAAGSARDAANAFKEKSFAGGVVTNTLKAMTTAAFAYQAANLVKGAVESADAWQVLGFRLKEFTGSEAKANAAMKDVYNIAQTARVPLKDVGVLFGRMYDAMHNIGYAGPEVSKAVAGVAYGLKVFGSTGEEARSAMLQLSQAMNKGKLDGQEFNSIAENGKPILKAIAKEMDVSTGALFKLRSEGKITAEVMAKALVNLEKELKDKIGQMPMTLDDAMTTLKNAWQKGMGELGKDTKFNQAISGTVASLESAIPGIVDVFGSAFTEMYMWVTKNKDQLSSIWSSVKGIASDVMGIPKWFMEVFAAEQNVISGLDILQVGTFLFRAGIAAAKDVFEVLFGIFKTAGAVLLEIPVLFAAAFSAAITAVSKGITWLLEKVAKAAEYFGAMDTSNFISGLATSMGGFADDAKNITKSIVLFANSLVQVGKEGLPKAMDKLDAKQGNLEKFLNGGAGFSVGKEVSNPVPKASWQDTPEETAEWKKRVAEAKAAQEKANGAKEAAKQAKLAAKELEQYNKLNDTLNAKLSEQWRIYGELTSATTAKAQKESSYTEKALELEDKLGRMRAAGKENTIAYQRMLTEWAKYTELAFIDSGNRQLEAENKAHKTSMDGLDKKSKVLDSEIAKMKEKLGLLSAEDAIAISSGERAIQDEVTNLQLKEWAVGLSAKEQELLKAKLSILEKIKEKESLGTQLEGQKAVDALNKELDPRNAEKFGDALATGFGKGAKALGKLMNGMDDYAKRESKIAKMRKEYETAERTGQKNTAELGQRLIEAETKARLTSYADMFGAAKGFFSEGSKGYKMMEAAETSFRVAQMAMSVANFVKESEWIGKLVSSFVGGEAAKTAAHAEGTGERIMLNTAQQGSNATTALSSALAAPFPMNLAAYATVAAMLAALGIAVSGRGGGGGGMTMNAGKGTVLGDKDAVSQSISKGLEKLNSTNLTMLEYSAKMAGSLQRIESTSNGMGSLVGKTAGLNEWKIALQTKQTTVGDISKGIGASTESQLTGLVKMLADAAKPDNSLADNLSKGLSKSVQDAADSITTAGKLFGKDVSESVKNAKVDFGNIDLTGTGKEVSDRFNAIISQQSDRLVEQTLPEIKKFQQLGEGAFETLTRVASGYETSSKYLERLGIKMVNVMDLTNKSATDVGAEILKESIIADRASKNLGAGISGIVSRFTGSESELESLYTSLTKLEGTLRVAKLSFLDVSSNVIAAAGSLDDFTSAVESYYNLTNTDTQKLRNTFKTLSVSLKNLGVDVVPATVDDFKKLVESYAKQGEEGQKTAVKLMQLSDMYSELEQARMDAVRESQDKLKEAYDESAGHLQDTIDKFNDFSKSLAEFKQNLLTGDNSPLTDTEKYNVQKTLYDNTLSKALAGDETAIGNFQNVAEQLLSLSKSVYASGDKYKSDFDSVLTATNILETYTKDTVTGAEKQLAALDAQVGKLILINESVIGVQDAINNLEAILKEGVYRYSRGGTSSVADSAQQTMYTTLPVTDRVLAQSRVDGSHKDGLDYVPYDGYIAELHKGEAVLTASENKAATQSKTSSSQEDIVEELQRLRQEVAELRKNNIEAARYIAESHAAAVSDGANTVSKAVKDSSESAVHASKIKPELV